MLWNRFDTERAQLNLYDNPQFEPGSGITDRAELTRGVEQILQDMRGEPHARIKATAFAYVLDHAAIQVDPKNWFGFNFCGWLTPTGEAREKAQIRAKGGQIGTGTYFRSPLVPLNLCWREEIQPTPEFLAAAKGIHESGAGGFGPDYEHSVPDWDSVIGLGFPGLLARARRYRDEKVAVGVLTEKQAVYYEAIETEYEAILRFCSRLLACARKHEADDDKMPIVIECLETLCVGAPKTYYQYLTLTYLYHLIQQFVDVIQVRTLGNLDVDGYPFYRQDRDTGRLNKEQAIELLQYFFEAYANQGHIHGQPIYFGGFDENGESLINELSYMMLEAHDRCSIINPKLILKVMPNTPDAFLKKALDMVRRGNSSIVFINEELGVKIQKKLGRTDEEVRRLVGTGCNNFAARGCESTPEHMYVNLAKGIELVFGNGVDPLSGEHIGCETGDVADMHSFEDFRQAFYRQVECLMEKAFTISDFYDAHLEEYNPAPMYSGTMPHSLACGRDAYFNGAKYNNTDMFLSCHATAADSLMMVKKYVFDKKVVSLPELRDILARNWEGAEALRAQILRDHDKFGNNRDEPDAFSVEMLARFTQKAMNRKNVRGGHFVANGESIDFSHRWAPFCGATPDGRAKGNMLSKNMGASIGQDYSGITALIQSVTKIDASNLAYGSPFDYVLHPSAVQGDEGLTAMLGLLRTFMRRGGYGFQGNVLDSDTLRKAQAEPEKYQNLQVRLCGWNWYFTKMEKHHQDEFITRTEHAG